MSAHLHAAESAMLKGKRVNKQSLKQRPAVVYRKLPISVLCKCSSAENRDVNMYFRLARTKASSRKRDCAAISFFSAFRDKKRRDARRQQQGH